MFKIIKNTLLMSVNLFGLDYFGPMVGSGSGGSSNFIQINNAPNTCYSNYCGVINLHSNQNSWFTMQLSPDRDRTNRHGANFYYRIGVRGGSNETMSVYYWEANVSTNFTLLSQVTGSTIGSGLPIGQFPTITNWTGFNYTYSSTNDLVLLFYYQVSKLANNYPNSCGVDYFCWETDLVDPKQPQLRADYDQMNIGAYGSYRDTLNALPHSIRVSWPKNNSNLYYTTKLNGIWSPIQSTNYWIPVFDDPTHTRTVTYVPYDQFYTPTKLFKLM